jgi:predicted acylesterase/phospholipase RssA
MQALGIQALGIHPHSSKFQTLVLSGGALHGLSILGALHWLYEHGYLVNVTRYVGTSIGAVICLLLSVGYTPLQIFWIMSSSNIMDHMQNPKMWDMVKGIGAFDFEPIDSILRNQVIAKMEHVPTFSQLFNKTNNILVTCTCNLSTGRVEYHSIMSTPHLDVMSAVTMSSLLPLVFPPYEWKDCMYIDGGLADPFPILWACDNFDQLKIIGIASIETKTGETPHQSDESNESHQSHESHESHESNENEEPSISKSSKSWFSLHNLRMIWSIPVNHRMAKTIETARARGAHILELPSKSSGIPLLTLNTSNQHDMFGQGTKIAANWVMGPQMRV